MDAGAIVADYELQEELGAGSVGVVWRARGVEHGERVAIKFLTAATERDLPNLDDDLQALTSLRHRRLVRVLDAGRTDEGVPFIVTGHLRGPVLDVTAPRSIDEIVHIVGELLEALVYAHGRGQVHRNITPQNIHILPGKKDGPVRVRIADVGHARVLDERRPGQPTKDDMIPPEEVHAFDLPITSYSSPEQRAGNADVGAAADVFAVGVIAYQMLDGALPFDDGPIDRDARAALPRRADCPVSLARWIGTLLTVDRARRPTPRGALRILRPAPIARIKKPKLPDEEDVVAPSTSTSRNLLLIAVVVACLLYVAWWFGAFSSPPQTIDIGEAADSRK